MNCLEDEKTENEKINDSMQEVSQLTNVNLEREQRKQRGKIRKNIRAPSRTEGQVAPH